jgi:1-acyl-sn-glycerol-3-phosphate acyltransferase
MLFFIAIPYKLSYEEKLDKHKQYIFCANHFSYMDIASTALNHHNTIFVGKSEVARVPIFGFMYRKLHITVDRSKLKSRYSTLLKTKQALDEGKSLVIFPEGGIITKGGPSMGTFKDGAFRVSIEKQIPIVPVTIPFNWIILPPDVFLLKWKPMKAVFHKPIDPSKYTINDIAKYRELVRSIIQEELTRQLQHEN